MPIFFVEKSNIQADTISIIHKEDIKHISSVLRYKEDDNITLALENDCIYDCKIVDIDKKQILCKILSKKASKNKLKINLNLAQSIIKSAKQDMVIQKATELGAKNIYPIITENTVIKFDNDKDRVKKVEKWQKIADESCKQCERIDFPLVNPINTLLKFLEENKNSFIIACVERNTDYTIKQILKNNIDKKEDQIILLIGPEGGWSDKEILLLKKHNISLASLGNLILRAETACIKALSDVIYEYEL